MSEIKVSVIVYVLNTVSYIEKCVRSVMNQTLREIEILIIDGGSTDGTLEIIEKLAAEDSRIRIIHSAPGVGLQFNTGVREAKGEYIGICEADDYILPGMYEYQYETAEKNKLDILRADANHFFETWDGKEIVLFTELSKQRELYDKVLDTTKDMRVLRLGINSFWSGLYRREFLLEQKLFMNETKGAAYQDTAFYFLSVIQAKRVMLSKEAFYCYRLDNPGSSVNNPQRLTMLIDEYRLLKERLVKPGLFEKCKDIYFAWKVGGHLGFYDSLSKELRERYTALMYQDIYNDLASKEFSENELSARDQKIVGLVRLSERALREYLEDNYRSLNVLQRELENIQRDKGIVIFGSGNLGKLVCLYFSCTGGKAVAYADNNEALWGKPEGSVLVLGPEKAVQMYPEAFYIIANEKYSDVMREQLQQLGVENTHMTVCNNYGFFLKYILQKRLKEKN